MVWGRLILRNIAPYLPSLFSNETTNTAFSLKLTVKISNHVLRLNQNQRLYCGMYLFFPRIPRSPIPLALACPIVCSISPPSSSTCALLCACPRPLLVILRRSSQISRRKWNFATKPVRCALRSEISRLALPRFVLLSPFGVVFLLPFPFFLPSLLLPYQGRRGPKCRWRIRSDVLHVCVYGHGSY